MDSIFDKLIGKKEKTKSLSRRHTWVWRVEHKWQEVGPYNFQEETKKDFMLSERISMMHTANFDALRYPNWEIEGIQISILKKEGILNHGVIMEANRNWVSGFHTLKELYVWFDGLIEDLSECEFVIRKFSVHEDHVISGRSHKQLVFKRTHAHITGEQELSLKHKEEITGFAGEKILAF